jgi:hypothetical protein
MESTEEPIWDRHRIRLAQIEDQTLASVIQDIQESRAVKAGYELDEDGVLFFSSSKQTNGEPRLVAPQSMIPVILRNHHSLPLAGHQGIT